MPEGIQMPATVNPHARVSVTRHHIEDIEEALCCKSHHWGIIDPIRIVEAAVEVMGGMA